jgi:hypothetical protein
MGKKWIISKPLMEFRTRMNLSGMKKENQKFRQDFRKIIQKAILLASIAPTLTILFFEFKIKA